jgi:hypothetical protein
MRLARNKKKNQKIKEFYISDLYSTQTMWEVGGEISKQGQSWS